MGSARDKCGQGGRRKSTSAVEGAVVALLER